MTKKGIRELDPDKHVKRSEFGKRLATLLHERKMTQIDLADATKKLADAGAVEAHVNQSSISTYLRPVVSKETPPVKPSMSTIKILAKALEVSVEFLAGETPHETLDITDRAICEQLNITEDAVTNLKSITQGLRKKHLPQEPRRRQILDQILASKTFRSFVVAAAEFHYIEDCRDNIDEMLRDDELAAGGFYSLLEQSKCSARCERLMRTLMQEIFHEDITGPNPRPKKAQKKSSNKKVATLLSDDPAS